MYAFVLWRIVFNDVGLKWFVNGKDTNLYRLTVIFILKHQSHKSFQHNPYAKC